MSASGTTKRPSGLSRAAFSLARPLRAKNSATLMNHRGTAAVL